MNACFFFQTCVCTNRILVQEEVYDKFCVEMAKVMQSQLTVGNGMDPKTTVGPLINENAVKKVCLCFIVY